MKRIAGFIIFVLMFGCKQEVVKYTVNGEISGGAGRYLKIIDMTAVGLQPDSIELDMGGKFTFAKQTTQPGDYVLYFEPGDYIRITPLPSEIVNIKAQAGNLLETFSVTGSKESELVSEIIKQHNKAVRVIDSLNSFYMKNQLNPKLDSIILRLSELSDSVYRADKEFLEKFIKDNPGTMASYIALSQKLGPYKKMFSIENDLYYFEMVDTALYNRFDTIDIVKMMHGYLLHAKAGLRKKAEQHKTLIGKKAPDIILPNVYGDTLSLADIKDKYILVDFWGSWCRPCRKENKNLRNVYRKYRRKGFEIFQVAIERNKTDWKNTIREDRLYWKYQVSELNYMASKTVRDYGVKALPANFLINPDGVIIAKNLYGEELSKKLEDIFTKKTSQTQNGE